MAVEEGKRFIDFKLKNQNNETVTLDDFAGKWLVVYVYPKDDTPGCTIQGKSFTATCIALTSDVVVKRLA